jgi:hypothetical protein
MEWSRLYRVEGTLGLMRKINRFRMYMQNIYAGKCQVQGVEIICPNSPPSFVRGERILIDKSLAQVLGHSPEADTVYYILGHAPPIDHILINSFL